MTNYQCTITTETLLSHRICNTNLPKKFNLKINTNYKSTRNILIQSHTSLEHLDIWFQKNIQCLHFFFHKIIKKEYCLNVYVFKFKEEDEKQNLFTEMTGKFGNSWLVLCNSKVYVCLLLWKFLVLRLFRKSEISVAHFNKAQRFIIKKITE